MSDGITITGNMVDGQVISSDVTKTTTITGSLTTGGIGPAGPTGPTGPAGPSGPPGTLSIYFDVTDYGAVGDGFTDSTTAIQSAINAANNDGGIVFFPQGIYIISSALTMYTKVGLLGCGSEASLIHQTSSTAGVLIGTDVASISIEGLLFDGLSGTSGNGIDFGWSSNGNLPFLDFRDLWVRNFNGSGISLETPIVSHFDRVIVQNNGKHGFDLYHAGTSCVFSACWARTNAQSGYHFFESVYMNLSGCASDNNGINYLVESAQSIGFYACGSEGALTNGGTYNGYGFKISNSSVINIDSCWVTDNRNIAIWITDGSQEVKINAADNTPHSGAVNFIKTDVSTNSTIYELHNTTANSISAGTANIINDGALGAQFKDLYVKNSSGTLHLSAASDASEYNLSADTTGTLTVFGSGGQSLNLALLDGYLELDTLTATTVPYLDSNKRFVSSAVTPTELGYVHGVTSAIQTQLGLLAPLISPSFTTPSLGAATATSINKLTLTQPATGSTLTLVDGSSLITVGAFALTFTTTATTGITFPTGSNTMAGVTATQTLTSKTLTGVKLTAGTTTVAPLTFTAVGALLTSATANTVEWDGTDFYYTDSGPTRRKIVNTNSTQTLTNKTLTAPTLTSPVLGVATATSLNGLIITTTTGTLTMTNAKTLAVTNTLTLSGTDSTVMTFPSTSATIARTDAANTFTGHQTIEGVTSTGATGTGALVFGTAPTVSSLTVNTLLTANTQLNLVGTSGTLTMTAASDGGDYNIFSANGAQVLALYGSGGNTLNLNLLDGNLRLGSTDRITNAGVFFPQQAATVSAPSYVKGGMYFDTTLNKMRIGGASAWETVTSV